MPEAGWWFAGWLNDRGSTELRDSTRTQRPVLLSWNGWERTRLAVIQGRRSMKTAWATASALLAGIAIGAFGVHTVDAQKRPPAYVVADNQVNDQDNYMKVVAPVAEKTTAEAGGRFLARGKPVSLSGEPPKGRLVIVQFENMDQLQKWWNNPEWQAAHKKGEQYAKFRDMAIEGVSP